MPEFDFSAQLAKTVELYEAARDAVMEAELVGKLSHPQMWMDGIRPGADDILRALHCQKVHKEEKARLRLDAAKWHLMTAATEVWVRTASLKTEELRQALRGGRGNPSREARERALECLSEAVSLLTKARANPNHDSGSAETAKASAMTAVEGLNQLSGSNGNSASAALALIVVGATLGAGVGAIVASVLGAALGAFLGAVLPMPWVARRTKNGS